MRSGNVIGSHSPFAESCALFLKEEHALLLCHLCPCWSLGAEETELPQGYLARMLQEKGQALTTASTSHPHIPKLLNRCPWHAHR